MRIVFLSTGHPTGDVYPGGGTQYEIQGLAESLVLRGHDVHVVARSVTITESNSKGVHYVQVVPRGRDQIFSVVDFGRRAVAHVREINPDILYLSERFSAAFAARLSVPKVFVLHNYDGLRPYWKFAIGYNPANLVVFPMKNLLEEEIMRRCERVVVPTGSWLSYLAHRKIGGGMAISHGLRVNEYENRGDNGFLLYAGRLSRVKGVDVLLRGLARMDTRAHWNLVLTGKGPDEMECRRIARKLGLLDRVRFLGHVPRYELLSLYATCTAVVLPSRWETFGIAASEGLASGKTVIASDIPGPRDFIENGQNGLLFPPDDVGELSRRLTEVLEDDRLRRMLGAEARRRAIQAFDFERIALEHERLWRSMLRDGGLGT